MIVDPLAGLAAPDIVGGKVSAVIAAVVPVIAFDPTEVTMSPAAIPIVNVPESAIDESVRMTM